MTDDSIVTTNHHLVSSAALARRDARNGKVEPVTVEVIEEGKPVGLIAAGIVGLILTGFAAWTVNMVAPSVPDPINAAQTYSITNPNSL